MKESTVHAWLDTDYYAVLGVPREADRQQITRAYRRQARLHHPDLGAADDTRFTQIQQAYEVLGSQEQRARYDEVHRVAAQMRRMAAHRATQTEQRPAPRPQPEADAWIAPYSVHLSYRIGIPTPATFGMAGWQALNPWLRWYTAAR